LRYLIWVVAITNSLAAGVIAFVRYDIPDREFWLDHRTWIAIAVMLTVTVPLVQAAVVEAGERRQRKRLERAQKIHAFLAGGLIYLVEAGGMPWKNTGVQAFAVRGPWWRRRQDRLSKARVGAIATSGVKWEKGKGVIGRCWETKRHQYEDLEAAFAPYVDYDETQWTALSADKRFGLSFADFTTLRGKYGIVAAVPIMKGDAYIGCITADMPPLAAGQPVPNRERVLESLAFIAVAVSHVLD